MVARSKLFRGNVSLRAGVVAFVAVLLGACTPPPDSRIAPEPSRPSPPPAALDVVATRSSEGVVAAGGSAAPYNYGPTMLVDDEGYRAWWCSQLPGVGPAGDDILHAAASALDDVFRSERGTPAVPVFNGMAGGFDAMHTCDPSVVQVGDEYFLYYTGAAGEHAHGNAIGVASSSDGLAWRREAGGEPIVTPAGDMSRENTYGAGQPSVLHLDGWFYLMFTDTTAAGAGWNGAGQFVLRARDAEFSERVQALTESGFEPVGSTGSMRSRSVVDAFSADWMWVEALGAFAIAHQVQGGTAITFWDEEFSRHPYEQLLVPGRWREGPGLVRSPDGSAPVSPDDPCRVVPFDVVRATTANPAPTELRHFGVDVGVDACGNAERARQVLESFGYPSPERTVDLVIGGEKVRVERRSVAEEIVSTVLDDRVPALDELPVAGRIRSEALALRAPDGSVGLLDDRGRLWEVDPRAVEANRSMITEVSGREWNARFRAESDR